MTKTRYTIRNIDPEIMLEARVFSVQNRQALGETVTEALEFYFGNIEDEDDVAEDQCA